MYKVVKKTYRVDIYAFGVMLWELLTAKVPFEGLDETQILAAVQNGERSQYISSSEVMEKNAAALIELCLNAGREHSSHSHFIPEYIAYHLSDTWLDHACLYYTLHNTCYI